MGQVAELEQMFLGNENKVSNKTILLCHIKACCVPDSLDKITIIDKWAFMQDIMKWKGLSGKFVVLWFESKCQKATTCILHVTHHYPAMTNRCKPSDAS
jgi:hypothetical protein